VLVPALAGIEREVRREFFFRHALGRYRAELAWWRGKNGWMFYDSRAVRDRCVK
jgi:hypothetical protein